MLLLVFVLTGLRYPGLRGRRNDANISTSTGKRNDFLFLCLRLCLRRPGLHVGFLCFCLRRTSLFYRYNKVDYVAALYGS